MKYLFELKSYLERDKYRTGLLILLVFLIVFSIYALRPQIAGDSFHYIDSIEVIKTGIQPTGFVPMMIVSTYLGLRFIMFLDLFTGSIAVSWLLLNSVFYVALNLFFYSLLKRIFTDPKIAFLGTLFLATNYVITTFGLSYMMDMGGWAFYIASLYFSYRYLESEESENKWLYISSALVGIGGLYKEYSFVAYIVIFGLIIFKNWGLWRNIFWRIFTASCLSFGPFALLNVYGFLNFDYTYWDWFMTNQREYTHQNRIVEFIKSFGSVFNFGWFLFIPGFCLLLKRSKEIFQDKNILFMWLVILSCFSVLLWPVVTRVLFITMPAAIMVSCLFIKKINKYSVVLILIAYAISGYLMDAYFLDLINLPL